MRPGRLHRQSDVVAGDCAVLKLSTESVMLCPSGVVSFQPGRHMGTTWLRGSRDGVGGAAPGDPE